YNQFMTLNPAKLTGFIKDQGWSDFGIAPISDVESALKKHEGIFEKWVELGFQAEMAYLEAMKDDRYHPENKLPDVRSVLVLQAWYGSGGKGNIARYARGLDYHKILKKRLSVLSEWLKAQDSSISTYISVDSGPTVDRVLAEVAGLGFFGKNTNLIDPSKGSYFFIATLMTNVMLPATEKRRMPSCGDCKKCITACPTGAIVGPRVIDARRCIAYLTIESKEGIPEELRPMIGDRLFGCDICQEVCPFNEGRAGMQAIRIEELKAENGVGDNLDLAEILAIESDEEFLECFAGTSLIRAKRRGLLRNACVVTGNSGDRELISSLEAVLERESDDMLKEHAKWAIKAIENRATSV
ncbi:tRNA epoxyqueuosine(34) reductase QueG, partial [Patescibacteria group bacterium]|nr:tRNA epoxyqueuosine(34) reductase QueG [Patescibacteria group bacterium]